MYYVSLIIAISLAFFAGRFCVSMPAKIERCWLRRLTFWLIAFPGTVAVCLYLFEVFCEDLLLASSPSLFIGVLLPTTVFGLTFLISAFCGFRMDSESQIRRACKWNNGKRLAGLSALLVASLFVYDWQLKRELIELKESTLAEWRETEFIEVPDEQNAAVEFLSLGEHSEQLKIWSSKIQERFGDARIGTGISNGLFFNTIENPDLDEENPYRVDTLYVETDFTNDWFAGLNECDDAFEKLRRGADKPQFSIIRDLTDPYIPSFKTELETLDTALNLFQINVIATAYRGDLPTAYHDVKTLLAIARHFDGDINRQGQRFGNYCRSLASKAIEWLLYLEPRPPVGLLKPLIDQNHNPRYSIPQAIKWERADYITRACDLYLAPPGQHNQNLPRSLHDTHRMPSFVPNRLAFARDELYFANVRGQILKQTAANWDDLNRTGDSLLKSYMSHWPPVVWAYNDDSDIVFLASNERYNTQHVINLLLAAAIFNSQTGSFPVDIADLVPELLSKVPVSLRNGQPFIIRQFNHGLVIANSDDSNKLDRVLANPDAIGFAYDFYDGFAFVGTTFRLAHIREPDASPEVE